MANWHCVFRYDDRATAWLAEQGYPHPPAQPGNRLPTYDEVMQAWEAEGFSASTQLRLDNADDFDDDEGCFRVRGDLELEMRLLRRLCEDCGQLWVYPDCGSPAIVVDAVLSPEKVVAAYTEAEAVEDSWTAFHESMYGAEQGRCT